MRGLILCQDRQCLCSLSDAASDGLDVGLLEPPVINITLPERSGTSLSGLKFLPPIITIDPREMSTWSRCTNVNWMLFRV